jgi:hypothetical protein
MALQPIMNELKYEFQILRKQYFEHEIERQKLLLTCRKHKQHVAKLQKKTQEIIHKNAMALSEVIDGKRNLTVSPEFCNLVTLIHSQQKEKQKLSYQLIALKTLVAVIFFIQIIIYIST